MSGDGLIDGLLMDVAWHGARIEVRNGKPTLFGDIEAVPGELLACLEDNRVAIVNFIK